MDLDYITPEIEGVFPVVCIACYREYVGGTGSWDDPVFDATYDEQAQIFVCGPCWAQEMDY